MTDTIVTDTLWVRLRLPASFRPATLLRLTVRGSEVPENHAQLASYRQLQTYSTCTVPVVYDSLHTASETTRVLTPRIGLHIHVFGHQHAAPR